MFLITLFIDIILHVFSINAVKYYGMKTKSEAYLETAGVYIK
jgi:hypothetical protein